MKNNQLKLWSCVFISCTCCFSQIFPQKQSNQVWDGDKSISFNSDNGKIHIYENSKMASAIPVPNQASQVSWYAGCFWATEKTSIDGGFRVAISKSVNGIAWEKVVSVVNSKTTYNELIMDIFPLKNNLFLLVSPRIQFEGQFSFAAVGAVKNNKIEIINTLDPELESPYALRLAQGNPSGINPNYKSLYLDFANPLIARNKNIILIISERTGYCWVVDDSKDMPSMELVKIFPNVSEKQLYDFSAFEHSVLGCQPTKDGNFIIATRSEDAVLGARVNVPRVNAIISGDPIAKNPILKEKREESLKLFPKILWWELNGKTKKLTRVFPAGGITQILDVEALRKFAFTVGKNNEIN